MGKRQLGVVLTPAEVQDEGLDRVLDNIAGAGATAIFARNSPRNFFRMLRRGHTAASASAQMVRPSMFT